MSRLLSLALLLRLAGGVPRPEDLMDAPASPQVEAQLSVEAMLPVEVLPVEAAEPWAAPDLETNAASVDNYPASATVNLSTSASPTNATAPPITVSKDLEGYMDDLMDRMLAMEAADGTVEEAEEEEAAEDPPAWLVGLDGEPGYCLLLSGQVQVELRELGGGNKSRKVVVPAVARAEGRCGQDKSEMRLVWRANHSGEENLLNLVVKREYSNLAFLSGAFLRLHTRKGTEEFYASMSSLDYTSLLWPLRYQVNCPRTLTYSMAPTQDGREQRQAELHLTGLRIEAFREDTLHEHRPESLAPQWYRREWACEFHRTLPWAPYMVGGGLTAILLTMGAALLCRNSLRKRKLTKYASL